MHLFFFEIYKKKVFSMQVAWHAPNMFPIMVSIQAFRIKTQQHLPMENRGNLHQWMQWNYST
jgi:hypothetical protein